MSDKKRNDIIVGIVLILASIAVAIRYVYLMDQLETLTKSVFFLRMAFLLFTVILAGAGIKRLVSSRGREEKNK